MSLHAFIHGGIYQTPWQSPNSIPVLPPAAWPVDVPQSEFDALMALYDETDGDNWVDSWGQLVGPVVVGDLFGVTVTDGHVTQLNMPGNNLRGTIEDFDPAELPYLTKLVLSDSFVDCDVSGWVLPNTVTWLQLNGTGFTGDFDSWPALNSLTRVVLTGTTVSIDFDLWPMPNNIYQLNADYAGGSMDSFVFTTNFYRLDLTGTTVTGSPDWSSDNGFAYVYLDDLGWNQTQVDALIDALWASRANLLSSPRVVRIGGTNSATSGTYQTASPPTTGKEMIYDLVVNYGFVITYTA